MCNSRTTAVVSGKVQEPHRKSERCSEIRLTRSNSRFAAVFPLQSASSISKEAFSRSPADVSLLVAQTMSTSIFKGEGEGETLGSQLNFHSCGIPSDGHNPQVLDL